MSSIGNCLAFKRWCVTTDMPRKSGEQKLSHSCISCISYTFMYFYTILLISLIEWDSLLFFLCLTFVMIKIQNFQNELNLTPIWTQTLLLRKSRKILNFFNTKNTKQLPQVFYISFIGQKNIIEDFDFIF